MVAAGRPGHWRADQGDDLDIDDVGQLAPGGDDSFHGDQAAGRRHVDMGANGRVPVACHQVTGANGTRSDLGNVGGRLVGVHARDGAVEIALRIGDPIAEERLVQMGVSLDGRRQQHAAAEIDLECAVLWSQSARRRR